MSASQKEDADATTEEEDLEMARLLQAAYDAEQDNEQAAWQLQEALDAECIQAEEARQSVAESFANERRQAANHGESSGANENANEAEEEEEEDMDDMMYGDDYDAGPTLVSKQTKKAKHKKSKPHPKTKAQTPSVAAAAAPIGSIIKPAAAKPKMVRLGLTPNTGGKKPTAKVTGMVIPDYPEILKFAQNKLAIKGKKTRLFVCKGSPTASPGTELLPTMPANEMAKMITSGVLLTVSPKGDDYKGQGGRSTGAKAAAEMQSAEAVLPKPPRWPFPGPALQQLLEGGHSLTTGSTVTTQQEQQDQQQQPADPTKNESGPCDEQNDGPRHGAPPREKCRAAATADAAPTMDGPFPVLSGNILPVLKEAIASEPEIEETRLPEGYLAFDYKDLPEFPDPDKATSSTDRFRRALQRECRGLIVSETTGLVLARRFPKFFNLNERDESAQVALDLQHAVCYEKLDGMLCSAVPLDNGTMIWASRKSRSPAVEAFVAERPQYNAVAQAAIQKGCTALFEWCPSTHCVGVLNHVVSKLVLLAIRDNTTGRYADIGSVLSKLGEGVHVAPMLGPLESLNVRQWTDREGVVIRQPDGVMYKLKSFWYAAMAQAAKLGGDTHFLPRLLEHQPLKAVPTERIWTTALADIDDVIAACVSTIPETDQAAGFRQFVGGTRKAVKQLLTDLTNWARDGLETVQDSKVVCTAAAEWSQWPIDLIRAVLQDDDGGNVERLLRQMLIKLARAQEFKTLEQLLGIRWSPDEAKIIMEDVVLPATEPFCQFNRELCTRQLQDHVVQQYLPRRIDQIMGVPNSPTLFIPRTYLPHERKIRGEWERFVKHDVTDLRVDLQPMRKAGANEHHGTPEHALLLVQFGLLASKRSKNPDMPRGSFAGVLVPTDVDVETEKVQEAMELSFETSRMVKMQRHPVSSSVRLAARAAASGAKAPDEAVSIAPRDDASLTGPKVFCDLDGVLADFDDGVVQRTGRSPSQQPESKMWQRILGKPGFFENLKWIEGAQEMWEEINAVTTKHGLGPPTILTGLPVSTKKQVTREKRNWCRKHLAQDIEVITCMSKEKPAYMKQDGDILIDDRWEQQKEWTVQGGTFIHHVRPERTIYELRRALGGVQKIATADLKSGASSETMPPPKLTIDTWPVLESDKVVGFDAEWTTEGDALGEIGAYVSLVQLATDRGVYVIDMLAATPVVKEKLTAFLADPTFVKAGFALDNDARRLQQPIVCCVDLQEVAVDVLGLGGLKGRIPSLGDFSRQLLGLEIEKAKALQHSDWNYRPLSVEQIEYAASDAFTVLKIYNFLKEAPTGITMPPKDVMLTDKHQHRWQAQGGGNENLDFDPASPVVPVFSAVFLSPGSRDLLLAAFPSAYTNVHSDHVTCRRSPTEAQLRGLPVGERCEIVVSGPPVKDDGIEAIQVVSLRSSSGEDLLHGVAKPHITISTAVGVRPAEALRLDFGHAADTDAKPAASNLLNLEGIVGVSVATQDIDPLSTLPKKISDKVREFLELGEVKQSIRFQAEELTAAERSTLHEFAARNGMSSSSDGVGSKRRLQLTMLRKFREEEKAGTDEDSDGFRVLEHANLLDDERVGPSDGKRKWEKNRNQHSSVRRVTDASHFAALNIATSNSEVAYDGTITTQGVDWTAAAAAKVAESDVVVLRGLSGIGKSHLAKLLKGEHGTVCSADSYFESGAGQRKRKGGQIGYDEAFSVDKLGEAHDWCRDVFTSALQTLEPGSARNRWQRSRVVVDNTNSRQAEFKWYLKTTSEAGLTAQVVELYTEDKQAALEFVQRSEHSVPVAAAMRMLARWERCPSALLVKPLLASNAQEQEKGGLDSFEPANNALVAVAAADGLRFEQWVSRMQLPHSSKHRRKTHLSFEVSNKPAFFLDVPPKLMPEFLQRYAASGIGDHADDEPKFLSELTCAREDQQFKMFFDIDHKGATALSTSEVQIIAQAVQACLRSETDAGDADGSLAEAAGVGGRVLVTGRIGDLVSVGDSSDGGKCIVKTGLHVHCPDTVVTAEVALLLRRAVIALLKTQLPQCDWEETVDDGVYAPGNGIRMLGSRKVSKAVNVGRVYRLLLFLEASGEVHSEACTPLEAMQLTSIHLF